MTSQTVSPKGWLDPYKIAVIVVIISVVVFFVLRRRPESFVTPDAPRDVVLLHQLGHGVTCPSLSPFVLKVETFLRIHKIPYKSLYDRKMGPKSKTPWIEYNGDVVPDSTFIIRYLSDKLNINMDAKMTSYQKGVAIGLQRLAEENLYFQLGLWRAVNDEEKETFTAVGLPWIYKWILERNARTVGWHHGIGRHSVEEQNIIAHTDLEALSNALGDQDYFFGSSPTEVDCALFGQLAQWIWQAPRSHGEKLITEKFPNLKRFCERIKDKYWPDWEELVLQPSTE